jgi:hypothetical protein
MSLINIVILNGESKKQDVITQNAIVLDQEDIKTVKFHGLGFVAGFLSGADKNRSLSECIGDGIAGTVTTALFSVLFPKTTKALKQELFN